MSDQNDTFQVRLERTHCEQDWPCAMSGLAHELGDAYATLTEQVETLTANNAALIEAVRGFGIHHGQCSSWTFGPCDCLLSNPTEHPGAALLEEMSGLRARVVTLEAQLNSCLEEPDVRCKGSIDTCPHCRYLREKNAALSTRNKALEAAFRIITAEPEATT